MTDSVGIPRRHFITRRRIAAVLLALCWIILLQQPVVALGSAFHAQPTSLAVIHRSGQSFITWVERAAFQGESYRVYRHSAPITAGNLADAALLYEVTAGSARFYANRYKDYSSPPNWMPRYVDRFVIHDASPQLAEGTGLLVWTLAPADFKNGKSGNAYYAVTTVANGVENTADFGPQNTAGPVAEAVGNPAPVMIKAADSGWHAFIQYMNLRTWNPTFHAPNGINSYYGLAPALPEVSEAIQYAYDYAIFVPGEEQCGAPMPATLPVLVTLHAWQGNVYPPPSAANNLCAYVIAPVDVSETWWFGFAQEHDYRQGGAPAAGDRIANYTEYRVLRMVYDLLRDPISLPADPERVYVSGFSMGAGGALAFALRYPNVFAAAYASKPMTNYLEGGGWLGTVTPKWGRTTLALPVEIAGPAGWADPLQPYNGLAVYAWQNHQENLRTRLGDEMVPFGLAQALNDTSIPWVSQGAPMAGALTASRHAWGGVITENGHVWDVYAGLPPTLQMDGDKAPFADLQARRSETVPALTNGSADLTVSPNITPTTVGGYNQTLRWSSSWDAWDGAPIDTAAKYQISLCGVAEDAAANLCGTGVMQTVDVTPRRVQNFPIVAGQTYQWQNRSVPGGELVDSGQVQADAAGRLTVPQFEASPQGNRLVILLASLPLSSTLEITTVGGGRVDAVPQRNAYAYGEEVTLTAVAEPGWTFAGWSGSVHGAATSVKLPVAGDEQVSAVFVRESFEVYLPALIR